MNKIIIDGSDAIFGRLCSFAAKKVLEGNEIIIVNSGKVLITGNRNDIVSKYDTLRKKGGFSQKGPKISRSASTILKRAVRGMIPDFRRGIGKESFKRIKCYNNIPEELKNEKILKMDYPRKLKFIELNELVRSI
jgi:large subunit ribosomal protein L13